MTLRISRRRAVQAAMATAAAGALAPVRTSARQATPAATQAAPPSATPAAGGDAAITAAQVDAALDQLDGLVEDAMARTGVPGAAVAVVHDDAVVYERGFGVRALGRPEPVTPETVFQIASMSKPIASTLVAALVGDGTTSWDAPVASLDPGFALLDPIAGAQCTLRDMFCHRSGLPAYAGDELQDTFGYGRDEIIRRLRSVPPAAPFRTAFAYVNFGIAAAAYAAARPTGQAWEDLAEARLFGPLGMTSTSYRFDDFLRRANRATPHYRAADGAWTPNDPHDDDAAAPAGGVSTNLPDLGRWVRLQLANGTFEGRPAVASAALLETHRPQILTHSPADPATGPLSFYGLAWFMEVDGRGRLLLNHGGDFSSGWRTGVYLLPAAGLGIVVLTNAWPNPLRDAVPRAFLDTVEFGAPTKDWVGEIEAKIVAGLAQQAAPRFPQGDPPAGGQPPLPAAAYAGSYANDLYGTVAVAEAGGGLEMVLGANPAGPLRHWDRDAFSYPLPAGLGLPYDQAGVVFLVGPEGKAESLTLPELGDDATATFARVADGAKPEAGAAGRVG